MKTLNGTEKNAPNGMYRVIGLDTFDNSDFIMQDLTDLDSAKSLADSRYAKFFYVFVYDSTGECVYSRM